MNKEKIVVNHELKSENPRKMKKRGAKIREKMREGMTKSIKVVKIGREAGFKGSNKNQSTRGC